MIYYNKESHGGGITSRSIKKEIYIMKRRNFLKISLSSSAVLALSGCNLYREERQYGLQDRYLSRKLPELFDTPPQAPEHVPIAIIGSGFGGSISALRLSQADKDVAIIERGNRWPTSKYRKIFAHDMFPDGRSFWHRKKSIFPALPYDVSNLSNLRIKHKPILKFSGVLDIIEMDGGLSNEAGGYNLLLGTGVGGGSLIYTGVKNIPKKEAFKSLYPQEINYEDMVNIYYPKVQSVLGYSYMPNDIYNSRPFQHSRDWDKEIRRAGYNSEKILSNFNWKIVRDELRWRSLPSATLGLSNFGNSNGVKSDLRQNYIPQAEATGRTTIYHNQEVQQIIQKDKGFELSITQYNAYGDIIKTSKLTCDKLIMSAGSYHTTRLLMNAKAKNEIIGLNDYVGKNWGDNHNKMAFRQGKGFDTFPRLSPQASPSASAFYDANQAIPTMVENWANASLFEVGVSMMLSVGVDTNKNNRGEFKYNSQIQDTELIYPKSMRNSSTQSLRNINTKVARANNQRIGAPGFNDVIDTGAHPLGGMEIGKATDIYGRVNGVNNLYIMDGSQIPGNNGGANPSLTIAALTERNIEYLIENGDFNI